MTVTIRRLAPTFCGEIGGVDLTRLDDFATGAIKQAWLAHKVLVFHDQQLDEDSLVRFAECLGDVEIHLRQTRTTGRREVLLVSNKKENGQPIGRLGNQELNWHMDQIFMANPTAGTMLYAVEVTPEGGDTWFCDLGAASQALPPAGGSFLAVILGHIFAKSALSFRNFSSPGSVSGLIASIGHSGSQTPQSMHSSGWMTSMFAPS